MNATSAYPARPGTDATAHTPAHPPAAPAALVWDAPVRVVHWLMVLCFAGAYLTAERETWRLVHVTLGYTMAGLVAFRLVWGLVGTRHARFASFVRGPQAVVRYLRSLLGGKPEHHSGHNPAGAWAILAILGLSVGIALSGWATYNDLASAWVEELHEALANSLLVLVGVHIAAVLVSSWLHRDNLVGAMLTGRKRGAAEQGIRSVWRSVAVLVLAAVLVFWTVQWQGAPSTGRAQADAVTTPDANPQRADHDD